MQRESFQRSEIKKGLLKNQQVNMKTPLLALATLLWSTACTTSVRPNENYLDVAAQHCNYPISKLGWLQTIVTTEQYQKPNATVPAPIRQISLSGYDGSHVFLLDSDLSSCVTCPWAILDCNGQPFASAASSTPTRDKVIWKK